MATDPALSVAWNAHGLVLKALGRMDEAEDAYRTTIRHDRDDSTALTNLEILLREMDRAREAEALRRQNHRARERNPYHQSFLAEEALHAGRLDEATEHVKRAIKLQRREPQFHLTQARILAARGDVRGAAESLERAKALAKGAEKERYAVKLVLLREQLAAVDRRE